MANELKYHEPGLYFGMSFEEYLADPSLSNSGIQNLLISPLDYWVNSPLNPHFEPEETKATELGKAFHVRILEGREAFEAAYAPAIDKADYPDALKSGEELRAQCAELGLAKSGTLAEMAARIREADCDVELWVEIEEEYKAEHAGKAFLPAKDIRQIELAAKQIEANPEAARMFRGGHPEVSIFWIDRQTGVRMKARLDYLKPGFIVDLKTFANSRGKRLISAVASATAEYGYGIQAHIYLDAVKAAERLPCFAGDTGTAPVSLLEGPLRFVFLFQQTGRVPNVVLREFLREGPLGLNAYYLTTQMQYRDAVLLYRECFEKYGTEPWAEQAVIEPFDDTDFPAWMFN